MPFFTWEFPNVYFDTIKDYEFFRAKAEQIETKKELKVEFDLISLSEIESVDMSEDLTEINSVQNTETTTNIENELTLETDTVV